VIADEIERLSDPRLGLVTVTGVDVSPDLRHATVYYSALVAAGRRGGRRPVLTTSSDDTRAATQDALRAAAPHIRAALGRQVRLKYVPELVFREDPALAQGERVDQILRDLHEGQMPAGTPMPEEGPG
jgi:ribosome-binding factor A